jgi:3-oxoacyl-[acyl-carrier-protein] synthase II
MSPARRVVITGIGAITPIGSGRDGMWQGIQAGTSAVRRITRFDATAFRSQVAAEIADFDPLDYMDSRRARRLDRFSQLAVAASRQALDDADLSFECGDDVAVYLGSALGGIAFAEEQHVRFLTEGVRGVESSLALSVFGGAGATNVAIELGVRGPTLGNANSCASGVIAIGEAFRLLKSGAVPMALAGGVEAPLAPLTFGAFALIKAMSTRNDDPATACRPFDVARDGFVMGEGAGVLVLEELSHAQQRGAEPLAELVGYGVTNDAYHMTAPLPDGAQAARAINLALREAELTPDVIGYVNAHSTGTPLGDAAEAVAIQRALGPYADQIPVSGTKGQHGHALGATGAFEVAITALALRRGWLPPTTNLLEADPCLTIRHVIPPGEHVSVDYAVKNSFGFGGINACLALARWQH